MKYPQAALKGCPKCGASVFDYEGRLYSPLREYLLTGNLVGRGQAPEFRRAYVEHSCRLEDLEQFQQDAEGVVSALKRLIEDNPPTWLPEDLRDAATAAQASNSRLREVTASAGLTRECPRCGTGVGDPCENLLERKRGNTVPTKNPHQERLPLPETLEAAQIDLAREESSEAHGLLNEIREALKTEGALTKLLRLAERY